jgi:hypothetical protein
MLRTSALATVISLVGCALCAASDDLQPCDEFSRSEAVFVGVAAAPVKRWVQLPDNPTVEMTLTPIEVERAYRGVSTPVIYVIPLGIPTRLTPGVRYLVYGRHYRPPDIVMASPGMGAKEIEQAASDLAFLDGVSPSARGGTISGVVQERSVSYTFADNDPRAPLGGIVVRIENEQYSTEAITDADGNFVASGVPAGLYKLNPQLRDGLVVRDPTSSIEAVVQDGGCATRTIDVHPNGRVRGILRDPDGRPLSFTSVDLMPMDVAPEPTTGQIRGTSSVSTNVNGEFEFEGRPAGRYYLGVSLYNAPNAFGPSYPRTYYPGTTDRASGEPIVIESSTDSGLHDFSIPAILAKGELKIVVDGAPPGGADVCVLPLESLFKIRSSYRAHPGHALTVPVVDGQPYEVHVHLRYPGGHLESAPYVFTATSGTTWVRLRPDQPRTLHP